MVNLGLRTILNKTSKDCNLGLSQKEMQKVFKVLIHNLKEQIKQDGKVFIAGLGRFYVTKYGEKSFKSPFCNNEEIIHVPSLDVVKIRLSKEITQLFYKKEKA